MTFNQVLKRYKSQAAISERFGWTIACINNWKRRGIPLDKQLRIQDDTGGQLKVRASK